jgi:hypothetical protein
MDFGVAPHPTGRDPIGDAGFGVEAADGPRPMTRWLELRRRSDGLFSGSVLVVRSRAGAPAWPWDRFPTLALEGCRSHYPFSLDVPLLAQSRAASLLAALGGSDLAVPWGDFPRVEDGVFVGEERRWFCQRKTGEPWAAYAARSREVAETRLREEAEAMAGREVRLFLQGPGEDDGAPSPDAREARP